MKKNVTIIGARPQIIKAAALSRAIKNSFSDQLTEIIIHTGQHYDENMSQVFFDEMKIPKPNYNLGVGSASHGEQTAEMIKKIETILLDEKPDFVVLYGDTNSTLAGSIAAVKIHIPIVHIEAGLRSFNKSMPEEINRIVCDHSSTMLFTPTQTGINNLIREGFSIHNKSPYSIDNPGVFHCGDVMYDNSLYFSEIADQHSQILKQYNLEPGAFVLGTIHRDANTDDPKKLSNIFEALTFIADQHQTEIVLPLHPRTVKMMKQNLNPKFEKQIRNNPYIKIIPPASFFDMIVLEKNCRLVMTDSGGVQKEAYYFEKPVIILRPETEWVEIVESGNGIITDANKERILNAFQQFSSNTKRDFPMVYGDGHAAEFICSKLIQE